MKAFRLRILLVLALIGANGWADHSAGESHELVLASGTSSPIPRLTVAETRKLFLGVPVEKNGVTIKPLLNASNKFLFEVFLQKVTYMSAEAYDKQLLSIVFRLGGQRPPTVTDLKQLEQMLQERPDTVTFMWASDLQQLPGLRAISTLWSGAQD